MRYDIAFINGVVKSRECKLLGDKLLQMAEGNLSDALRVLRESSFGGEQTENTTADELIIAEENLLNDFIKKYSPDDKTEAFLLAEYDFHNAEALVKCEYANADEQKTLLPEGCYEIERIKKAVLGEASNLPKELVGAINSAVELFQKELANGLEVDCIFKSALFEYLISKAKSKKLKEILADKADVANISSAVRSRDFSLAEKMYVSGGKLPKSRIKEVCELPFNEIYNGKFPENIKTAIRALEKGEPLKELEKAGDDFPFELLSATRYDMIGSEPFLFYVLRRRAEIKNVRIITVCLSAGLTAEEIQNKIRLY